MKYTGNQCNEISFPLGGLGTGCVGLKGNGALVDWEIFNRPNKNSLLGYSHFAVKAMIGDQLVDARVMHGDIAKPYDGHRYKGPGSAGPHQGVGRNTLAGMPHFEGQTFTGEYPFAEVAFDRGSFPAEVKLLAFNPFIPLNDKDSTIPGAFFEVSLTNRLDKSVDYTVCGVLTSPYSQSDTVAEMLGHEGVSLMKISNVKQAQDPSQGHLCIATDCPEVSFQRNLFRGSWFDQLNTYWSEFCSGKRFSDRVYGAEYKTPVNNWMPLESSLLAAHFSLEPGEERTIRFFLGWYYPIFTNYWNPAGVSSAPEGITDLDGYNRWRNYYAELFDCAEGAAWYSFKHWSRLKEESMCFKNALYACSMPDDALDRAVSNLSTLKSPTCIRLTDGSFWAFEGCQFDSGSCEGSCDHVWNYAYAMPFLFPSLERSMRELSFRYGLREDGGFAFRLHLPLNRTDNPGRHRPCADGQFGNIIKTYREWKISGDDAWLRKLWPDIKRAIAFAWDPRNQDRWDPEKTGVLWGRQHHTLDLEMFGPSSWLVSMYLTALKAAVQMADYLGEQQTATEYREIFARGKAWSDEHLFNGEYFNQKLALKDRDYLNRYPDQSDQYWNEEVEEISFQIGEGCAIDQVLGQWHANCCGLGEIFDSKKTRSALRSIYRYNYIPRMRDYPNTCRIFCLNDESGTVICAWPSHVKKPKVPLFYSDETMHGFEYQAAICMIQEGLLEEGFEMIRSIAKRYDGERRNPFDEVEAGSHYARSMASFALFPAIAGFRYDMPRKRIGFDPLLEKNHFTGFFSLETGWGQLLKGPHWACIKILYGELRLRELDLPFVNNKHGTVKAGEKDISYSAADGILYLEQEILLQAGESLDICD